MNEAFISLGSNIEPREKYLEHALHSLKGDDFLMIKRTSSIYETAPVGYVDQAHFLNMVIHIHTSLTSIKLLKFCQEIEQKLGRKRTIRFGPRTIDLDILVYNQENKTTEQLILPHPRMHERAFVLVPLNEIAPHLKVPKHEQTVSHLLSRIHPNDIKNVVKWN